MFFSRAKKTTTTGAAPAAAAGLALAVGISLFTLHRPPAHTAASPPPLLPSSSTPSVHVRLDECKNTADGVLLGVGANSLVRRGVETSNRHPVAVKLVKRNSMRLEHEIAALTRLMESGGHANIVPFYGVANAVPDHPDQCGLVFEIFPGGELYESVVSRGLFTEHEAKSVVRQIASALRFLHSLGIVHGDIKPENILCKPRTGDDTARSRLDVALCDFGSARELDAAGKFTVRTGEPIGTIPYSAPELLVINHHPQHQQQPPTARHTVTAAVDVFSLGVVLFVLLSGQLPFDDPKVRPRRAGEIARRIIKGEYEFDSKNAAWRRVSDEAKDLLRCMLERDASKRISIDGILAHAWLQQ